MRTARPSVASGGWAAAHTAASTSKIVPNAVFRKPSSLNAVWHESATRRTARWHSAVAQLVGSGAPAGTASPTCPHTALTKLKATMTCCESSPAFPVVPHGSSGPPPEAGTVTAGVGEVVAASWSSSSTSGSSSEGERIVAVASFFFSGT